MKKRAFGYKIHLLLSIILNTLFIFLFNPEINVFLFFIIGLLYSILPDIDITSSKAYKILIIFLTLTSIFLLFYAPIIVLLILIIILIITLSKHRSFVHSFWFSILISLPLIFIGDIYFLIGLLNYVLHILVDRA